MRNLRVPILIAVLGGSIAFCASCSTNWVSSESRSSAQPSAAPTPTVEVATVESRQLAIIVRLPGELQPYEEVAVFPKVTGFVDSISVDRGSIVKSGQLMIRLIAPEIAAQRAEAQSKLQGAEAQRIEAEAKLASDESTYERLKRASATPGVVAGNDLEVAQKAVEADRARVQSARESAEAAKAALKSITEIEGYLQVRAPFDGVVTERNVHPGTLVGPATGSGPAPPLVRVETTARLRLVVPVPEKYVSGMAEGAKVQFSVAAYPNQTFSGTVARIAHSLEPKTRTMPIELDVNNSTRRLAAGMFPEVLWPVRRSEATLFVPVSSVARTMEAIFVVRIRDGQAEWVNVQPGELDGKSVEVFGELRPGDQVALRGSDELRPGTKVAVKRASADSQGGKK
jgi:membrane fusion protein, multidrug efflux system